MPDMRKDRGLKGESAKETWLSDSARREFEESMKGFNYMKGMPIIKPVLPWASIGQAPDKKQLENSAYSGTA